MFYRLRCLGHLQVCISNPQLDGLNHGSYILHTLYSIQLLKIRTDQHTCTIVKACNQSFSPPLLKRISYLEIVQSHTNHSQLIRAALQLLHFIRVFLSFPSSHPPLVFSLALARQWQSRRRFQDVMDLNDPAAVSAMSAILRI